MKEFEKRFNKNYPLPPTTERGPVGRDFKSGCENMWRAALEWVLSWETDPESIEIIQKELDK